MNFTKKGHIEFFQIAILLKNFEKRVRPLPLFLFKNTKKCDVLG